MFDHLIFVWYLHLKEYVAFLPHGIGNDCDGGGRGKYRGYSVKKMEKNLESKYKISS